MKKLFSVISVIFLSVNLSAQLKWKKVDELYGPLPSAVHVYKTTDSIDGKPNIAFYVEAKLRNKKIDFATDTTFERRLTPSEFYAKNDNPLVVVNGTFFSFETNRNLNIVIKDSRLVGYNIHDIPGRGKDTLTYRHVFGSAIGITNKRIPDVAWLRTDSSNKYALATQNPILLRKDSFSSDLSYLLSSHSNFKEWKMQTAMGGGPVLLQNGEIKITNDDEWKFAGKAIDDKHPRTAMGYTKDGRLIILVVQGRFPGIAEGASLRHLAQMLKDLGCVEALNLDGGGSSCMLVNGKETIKPSDAKGQRPVPAVFIIK